MTNKLHLDGFVGQVLDLWSDDIPSTSYKGMKANLEGMSGDLELHINSKGGDAFEGMAMLGLLKGYEGKKTALVQGICASAATLPLFAMDEVKAQETSMFLFHKSATMSFGHADDLRKSANELDTIDQTVIDLYMKKFKGTEAELIELLDSDTLISAKKALELGLIDEIIPDVPEADVLEPEPETEQTELKSVAEVALEAGKEAESNNDRLAMFAKALTNIVS